MKKKLLVPTREHKCIGCKLCMLAAARYEHRKLGVKDSPIKIKGVPGGYKIQIDYGKKIKNIEKIISMCPQNCFDVVDEM